MRVSVEHTPQYLNRCRIWLDGVDVTQSCVLADDVTGEVVLICRDEERHADWKRQLGPAHLTPDAGEIGPCQVKKRGNVTIDLLVS